MRSRTPLRVSTRVTVTAANSLAISIGSSHPSQEDRQVLGAQHGFLHGDPSLGEPVAVGGRTQHVAAQGADVLGLAVVAAAAEQQHRRLGPDGVVVAGERADVGDEVARPRRRVLGPGVVGQQALHALLDGVAVLVEVRHAVARLVAPHGRHAHRHHVAHVVGEQAEPGRPLAGVEDRRLLDQEAARRQGGADRRTAATARSVTACHLPQRMGALDRAAGEVATTTASASRAG